MLLDLPEGSERHVPLGPGATLLGGFAAPDGLELFAAVERIATIAPFRQMMTPGGRRMSVAMTNCGALGWVSDAQGYRYSGQDPLTGDDWPAMPEPFERLARRAAEAAGFPGFRPDACLVNRYEPGARLTLHQDRNEISFDHPIVSVSLGLPALFLWGGTRRADRPRRIPLLHGDVVVWGGPARLMFHGVEALPEGRHGLTGPFRYNLTFRTAG